MKLLYLAIIIFGTVACSNTQAHSAVIEDDIASDSSVASFDVQLAPFIDQTVFLSNEGDSLPSRIFLWSDAGATGPGAHIVEGVSITEGRVPATLVAYENTITGNKWFLVTLQDGTEGWVGRPYVFKFPTGNQRLLPYPKITLSQ